MLRNRLPLHTNVFDGMVDGCTATLTYPHGIKYNGKKSPVPPIWPPETLRIIVAITSVIAVIAAAKEPYDTHRIEQLELASQDDARRLGVQGITASIQPVHSGPVILKGHSQLISSQHEERAFFLYRGLLDGNACVAVEANSPMAKYQAFPNFYNPTTRTSACTRRIAERVQNLSSVLCRKGLGWCLSQTLDITYMALDPCFNLRIHRRIYLGKSHIIFDNINPVLREYFTLNLVAHHDTGPQIEYSSRGPHFKRRRHR
ncbi:hypothetical protein MANI_025276 [Metarhizium anisopliae]|nr:hypothetical protein MANI_025276 [Metarhizium anisopliae]